MVVSDPCVWVFRARAPARATSIDGAASTDRRDRGDARSIATPARAGDDARRKARCDANVASTARRRDRDADATTTRDARGGRGREWTFRR